MIGRVRVMWRLLHDTAYVCNVAAVYVCVMIRFMTMYIFYVTVCVLSF
jgi:hypothetical protein